ncbi:MAG TPA: hypothetical protein VMQ99_24870 [Acetobacteraceae bacterium]|nr:hypothetical protein [Acetobacteraceae bacterium]
MAVLLQACAAPPPAAPTARIFAADVAGGAKTCVVPKVAPVAGKETQVSVRVGNNGGWCGIVVNDGGKPYAAGLLIADPMHGKVLIHSVGDDTRIDYTPDPRFSGNDAFTVKLIPGDATIRAGVAVAPP